MVVVRVSVEVICGVMRRGGQLPPCSSFNYRESFWRLVTCAGVAELTSDLSRGKA